MGNALVAKSYQNLEQIGEPYYVGKKQYVLVRTNKGEEKQVKVYSKTEYEKYYGEKPAVTTEFKTQREVLFKGNFIHIVKGNSYPYKEWLKEKGATYRNHFGWMFQADVELPEEMPFGLELVKLPWSAVGADDAVLMADEKVEEVVQRYLYNPDGVAKGSYAGEVGERIEVDVCVENINEFESFYGISYCVRFRDENDNLLVWMTSSPVATNWEIGDELLIRGTVKECKEYRGECETILSRVKEMNK